MLYMAKCNRKDPLVFHTCSCAKVKNLQNIIEQAVFKMCHV